jgi:hypothetical protein
MYPTFTGGQSGDSVKQPTNQYVAQATALCGSLPNRHWLHSKEGKEQSGGVDQYTALLRGLCGLCYIVCPDFEG